jgi:hypothetical protein
VADAGGVRPRRGRDLTGRCLSFVEREVGQFTAPVERLLARLIASVSAILDTGMLGCEGAVYQRLQGRKLCF